MSTCLRLLFSTSFLKVIRTLPQVILTLSSTIQLLIGKKILAFGKSLVWKSILVGDFALVYPIFRSKRIFIHRNPISIGLQKELTGKNLAVFLLVV